MENNCQQQQSFLILHMYTAHVYGWYKNDDEAEQLKRNELKIGNIHGKDCNEIFDKGYYVVGDISLVRN